MGVDAREALLRLAGWRSLSLSLSQLCHVICANYFFVEQGHMRVGGIRKEEGGEEEGGIIG